MDHKEEAELLARCRSGDHEGWDVLFDLHYPAVGRFICQLSPGLSREDVEELCQETFIAIIRNIDSFNGQAHFQTWAFRIASNKTRDLIDKQAAAKRGGGIQPASLDALHRDTGKPMELPGNAPGPDDALLAREDSSLLHEALQQLGEPCREVIELRYFGDLSYEEISHVLSLNVRTVSSRLSKCLAKLEAIAEPLFSEGAQTKTSRLTT